MYSLTVIICTRNRAESLRITLDCLVLNAFQDFGVIVVDNGSEDNTRAVTQEFGNKLNLQYLFESAIGKGNALNRALSEGSLAPVIAILDDDMSPSCHWVAGVLAICDRYPDYDLFTGNTEIKWPDGLIPGWAKDIRIRSWMFSSVNYGQRHHILENGHWFSGNHFWFRSRVLSKIKRFENTWLTEPIFMLQLSEEGYRGISGPDAFAFHRIQQRLLEKRTALDRAAQVGRSFAKVRMRPDFLKTKQRRLFKMHPLIYRIYCMGNFAMWRIALLMISMQKDDDRRFVKMLLALERVSNYRELLNCQ
ncbi:MAG: glycosyltransferase family 2 protein [Acidobacteriota bacterium]|nr:glycosyltransferase family 2 protein [Acidobacteriota bacterium]